MASPGPHSRDDEQRVREHLYGPAKADRVQLDPGPVDVIPQEEPGVGAITAVHESERVRAGRIARSTAFFSLATGASRIAGLVREIVAAAYFGVKGPMSAFTLAFQVPNLVRSLFADAAIQASFVPVFTEQLEKGNKREAFRLASTLIYLVTLVLGAITALFVIFASVLMPLFAPGFVDQYPGLVDLMVGLSQILFPIVILLGISGLVVGVLNSYDRFGVFAIAPLFWNVAIIAVLVGLEPVFPKDKQIYAYAIGVLVGTVVQFAMVTYDLRNTPFHVEFAKLREAWTPEVRQVLLLMLPVSISLGLINFDLVINSYFGTLVSNRAPAAINTAFRIYMLPQGVFSVAVTTVLFPTLSRLAARRDYSALRATMANGMRQIVLLLVPAAAAILVLSEPMIQLVYQRGAFGHGQTELVATALFWFAFSLPFNGVYLLLTRTFFGLQRPWIPTAVSAGNIVVDVIASAALYGPFGVGGLVAATGIATAAGVLALAILLRRRLGRLELGRLVWTTTRVVVASAALAGASYGVWYALDQVLGRGTVGQIISLAAGLGAGALVYVAVVFALRIPEARQILRLLRRREA